MNARLDRRSFLAVSGAALTGVAATPAFSKAPIRGVRGVVIGYPHANEAGAEILAAGGNAVDAVVASALAAGVVALPSCGIGGYGGHMIIGTASRPLSAAGFQPTATAAAPPDM